MKKTEKNLLHGCANTNCHGSAKLMIASVLTAAFILAPLGSTISKAAGDSGREDKVTICHKGVTITVSKNALDAHLSHGDTVGACVVTR